VDQTSPGRYDGMDKNSGQSGWTEGPTKNEQHFPRFIVATATLTHTRT